MNSDKMKNNMHKKDIAIKMSKKSFVKEHKDLVKDLKSGNRAKLKAEARKQAKELREKV